MVNAASLLDRAIKHAEVLTKHSKQITRLKSQIEEARRRYETITGTRNLDDLLNNPDIRKTLPEDVRGILGHGTLDNDVALRRTEKITYETEIVDIMLDLPTAVTRSITNDPTTAAEKLDDDANTGATIGTKITGRAPAALASPVKAFSFVLVSLIITVISALLSAIGIAVRITMNVRMGLVAVLDPFCLLALLFDDTKDFFKQWVSQAIYFAIFGALFTTVFTIVMGMFGMLQEALLPPRQPKKPTSSQCSPLPGFLRLPRHARPACCRLPPAPNFVRQT